MNRKSLAVFCLLLIAILVPFSPSSAQAADYPEYMGYVNDYAHILSEEQTIELNREMSDFDRRTTIELAVVTVDSIGSQSPGDYAVDLGNQWGVGKEGKDNGIILLVSMDSRDVWIETGPGLAGEISDRQVQEIVDRTIIPEFRAGKADQGIIKGSEALVRHFDISIPSAAPPAGSAPSLPPADEGGKEGSSFMWIAAAVALFIAIGWAVLRMLKLRTSQAKENGARLVPIRKRLDGLVEEATSSLGALAELRGGYSPSIWKKAEEDFNSVDLNRLELEFIEAKRLSDRGWIQAHAAQELIAALEESLKVATNSVNAPTERLAQIRKAQSDSLAALAGLDSALARAESEVTGKGKSMATMMGFERAKQLYQEAKAQADQPPEAVDWIVLREKIQMAEEAIEQVSTDAIKDRSIAENNQGTNPEEMLARMRTALEAAERSIGDSPAARPHLDAARGDFEKAQEYRSRRISISDLNLLMISLDRNIELAYHNHQKEMTDRREMELARLREEQRSRQESTHVHGPGLWGWILRFILGWRVEGGSSDDRYTGGGGSRTGGRSSSGGRMGGGSSGGSRSGGGGRMGGGSHGGGRSSGGGGRMGGGSRGGGKW